MWKITWDIPRDKSKYKIDEKKNTVKQDRGWENKLQSQSNYRFEKNT